MDKIWLKVQGSGFTVQSSKLKALGSRVKG